MNFHSLLRVDAARRKADKYSELSTELESMIGLIMSNKNLRLDKLIKMPDPKAPALRIYIGSDYGFCGAVNSSVSSVLRSDSASDKVVIGKKLRKGRESSVYMQYDEVEARFPEIEAYFAEAVDDRKWSSIELVYNQYNNMTSIEQVVRRIYPIESTGVPDADSGDFIIEGEPQTMLGGMMRYYLSLQLKIALASSYASENIMRQNTTSESLKKIEEVESDELKAKRKRKNEIAFKKTIDNYSKQKVFENVKE